MGSGEWGHMSGAEGVVDSLRRAGVQRVFGIPSTETAELFDAFRSSPIELVLTTHEQGAAFMADAHARVTGQLGACLVSAGPGLTNALGGIAEARFDSSPVMVMVAGSSRVGREQQPFWSADLDPVQVAGPVCKGALRIDEPEEVPLVMARAVRLALEGEPGPVLVEVPRTVQRLKARMEGTGFRPGPRVLEPEAQAVLDKAAAWILRAKRVGIYAGAGCFEALEELIELAEKLNAPVASTISGLGVLPAVHPLSVGFGPGPAGMPLAERAFQQCDLVLAVGCRFAWPQGAHGLTLTQPMIHIDLGPTTSCRAEASTLCVNAPAKLALRFLLDRIAAKPDDGLRDLIRAGKKELRQVLASRPPWTDAVDPVKFFLQLREMMAAEDVLVLDSGHHAFYGIAAYPVWAPRTLLMPVGFRALGFSVPAAVAAKLALPDSRVVACIGDGGFQLTAFELLTARRCNVSPVVVVFADGHLGYVRYHQEHLLGRETCVDLVPVNYEDLAKALGVGYVVVRRDAELKAGLKRALTQEAPLILELRVAYREAAPYLDAVVRSDRQRLPRGMALRLGARLILRKILGR